MSIYRRPSSAPVARPFRPALFALAVVLALVAAACGSDSDDSDSGSASSDSETSDTAAVSTELASLETAVADYSAVPTEIVQTEPLTAKPPKKEVAFIVCADPSCVPLAGFLEDATTALGWDLITINATATDPGAAIQQAIDAGVDYIAADRQRHGPVPAADGRSRVAGHPRLLVLHDRRARGPGQQPLRRLL